MKTRTIRITAGLLVSAALGLGTVAAGITGASAAVDPCPLLDSPGWTHLSGNICEYVVGGSSGTATVPASATKLEAVLVGAGGASAFDGPGLSAAGGGGAVVHSRYPGTLPSAGSLQVNVTVGQGALFSAGGSSEILSSDLAWSASAVGGGKGGVESAAGDLYNVGGTGGGVNPGASVQQPLSDAPGGGARSAANASSPGAGYLTFGQLSSAYPGMDPELWPDTPASNSILATGVGFGGAIAAGDPTSGNGTGAPSLMHSRGAHGLVILRLKFENPAPPVPPVAPEIKLSASRVEQHGQVTVTVTGLDPDEARLSAEVHSTPFPLGAATADAAGVATWVFNVPADFPAGQHTVIVTRGAHAGQQLSIPLEVVPALAKTGGTETPMLLWAAAGALGVAGLAVFALRRRRA